VVTGYGRIWRGMGSTDLVFPPTTGVAKYVRCSKDVLQI
jgi:hypothetical protein